MRYIRGKSIKITILKNISISCLALTKTIVFWKENLLTINWKIRKQTHWWTFQIHSLAKFKMIRSAKWIWKKSSFERQEKKYTINEIWKKLKREIRIYYVRNATKRNANATQRNNWLITGKFVFFLKMTLHKKWSFPFRISSVNVNNPQETADLVTFTEEILNGKLHFLCSVRRLCSR